VPPSAADLQRRPPPSDGSDFAPLRADGLKTDEAGNVWMASGDGIFVYSESGMHLGTLRLPRRPSNCCFGDGFRGVYITAQKSVYHVPTRIVGTRTF
jgi:gluconolactonase